LTDGSAEGGWLQAQAAALGCCCLPLESAAERAPLGTGHGTVETGGS